MRGVGGGTSDVERAIDELYETPPEEFTKKRDAVAKGLKQAGDAAAAARIKAARKPTQVAYILNQLARRNAEDLASLVDVGRELARAQRKALRGGAGTDLRDAIARQREVVRALTTKTAVLMRELGVSQTGHLDEIAGALQAALADPAVGALLEEGRLEKPPAPAAGFPGAALLGGTAGNDTVAPRARATARVPKAEKAEKTKKTKKADKAERAREAARARRMAAEEKKAEAIAKAQETARAAEDARRAADALTAEAERLTEEAKRLATEAREREKEAAAARRAAGSAETRAKTAARAARAA